MAPLEQNGQSAVVTNLARQRRSCVQMVPAMMPRPRSPRAIESFAHNAGPSGDVHGEEVGGDGFPADVPGTGPCPAKRGERTQAALPAAPGGAYPCEAVAELGLQHLDERGQAAVGDSLYRVSQVVGQFGMEIVCALPR